MKIYQNKETQEKVVLMLNALLSGFQVYYQNLRGLHWNVKGRDFFEMHEKFEEWYDDAAEKIDEIAERILTIGGIPLHTFGDYIDKSPVASVSNLSDSFLGVQKIKENIEILLELEREILNLASENGDEATVALMGEYIADQEKFLWMLKAYLSD